MLQFLLVTKMVWFIQVVYSGNNCGIAEEEVEPFMAWHRLFTKRLMVKVLECMHMFGVKVDCTMKDF